VDRTVAAGCFAFLKRTMSKTAFRVVQQFGAIRAEILTFTVIYSAVLADHHCHGLGFALYSA
jgi:hypothetical protein